ncbi:carboxypeptidase-like regulatory domain-containing protein [Pedobacter sp. ASV12]|uniref:carboxypeptidase-like regulatory domain-containing protein n=1 Tax=Pedobacter sp. ASV12 TaxID=2795120 RepID=UPI0018EC4612|nr:carboxypeptidase-like regulatory domain-containing protein [Pedobacter sp. ASV12]
MKNMFLAIAFGLAAMGVQNRTETYPQNLNQAFKNQYCDYCQADFPDSHFPCLLKMTKAKINSRTGMVQFATGQPIAGVLIKIEKNTVDSLSLTSNEQGEAMLSNLQQGSYQLKLQLPFANPKSEFAGRPIAGVILRIGKMPAKLMLAMISDANGHVVLNNLEAGDYKLIISAPTDAERNSALYRSYRFENFNPNYKGNQ